MINVVASEPIGSTGDQLDRPCQVLDISHLHNRPANGSGYCMRSSLETSHRTRVNTRRALARTQSQDTGLSMEAKHLDRALLETYFIVAGRPGLSLRVHGHGPIICARFLAKLPCNYSKLHGFTAWNSSEPSLKYSGLGAVSGVQISVHGYSA